MKNKETDDRNEGQSVELQEEHRSTGEFKSGGVDATGVDFFEPRESTGVREPRGPTRTRSSHGELDQESVAVDTTIDMRPCEE
jgi:hypothetical protein